MNTVEKGDELEREFYEYLTSQKHADNLILGSYNSRLCTIHRKKKYPCNLVAGRNIEIDVSIELRRKGAKDPFLLILIECKNYKNAVQEDVVNGFSNTIRRISDHNTKGYVVFPSKIAQSAVILAQKYGIGVIKFDADGTDICAERSFKKSYGTNYIQSSLLQEQGRKKNLRFSASCDGDYFDSIGQLISYHLTEKPEFESPAGFAREGNLKFYNSETIEDIAASVHKNLRYTGGQVDLSRICDEMGIELKFQEEISAYAQANEILGRANFTGKKIYIYPHGNKGRERFTLSHEIAHFCLQHGQVLASETTIKDDLTLGTGEADQSDILRKLEIQANLLASSLLLPKDHFIEKADEFRINIYGAQNRGHGYIFVDDQPDKISNFSYLLDELSNYFGTSRKASEIRLKKLLPINDMRSSSPLINFNRNRNSFD